MSVVSLRSCDSNGDVGRGFVCVWTRGWIHNGAVLPPIRRRRRQYPSPCLRPPPNQLRFPCQCPHQRPRASQQPSLCRLRLANQRRMMCSRPMRAPESRRRPAAAPAVTAATSRLVRRPGRQQMLRGMRLSRHRQPPGSELQRAPCRLISSHARQLYIHTYIAHT
jgi:hypothetical protein